MPAVATRRRVQLAFAALAVVLVGLAAAIIVSSGSDPARPDVARFPGHPVRLTTAGGVVWVTTQSPGAVWTLDARTARRASSPVRRGGTPGPLAVARNGVWVADVAAAKVVPVRLRPRRAFPAIAVGADISDLALAAGALWVSSAAEGTVRVIDPGGRPVRSLRVGTRPVAIAADARRVVVADEGGSIAWIDARDRRIARAGVRVAGTPVDVALTGDTAWVADASGGRLVRVDLRTAAVDRGVQVGGRPVAVAAAAGDVYVLCAGDRSLVHVDGRRGEVRSRQTVGRGSAAIALDSGSVWVADAAGRAVRRFPR